MSNQYDFLSELEKKVYNWLLKNKIPFTTQQPMFGVSGEVGSAVVDFILTERNIVLRIMGSYYHSGLPSKARDELGRERLINEGYIVVDIWEENLVTPEKVESTMRLALEGIEVFK